MSYEEFMADRERKERERLAWNENGWHLHDGLNILGPGSKHAIYEVLLVNGVAIKFRRVTEIEKRRNKKSKPEQMHEEPELYYS